MFAADWLSACDHSRCNPGEMSGKRKVIIIIAFKYKRASWNMVKVNKNLNWNRCIFSYGRRTAFCMFSACAGVLGIVKALSVDYHMYVAVEFFEAALGYGFNSAAYVMSKYSSLLITTLMVSHDYWISLSSRYKENNAIRFADQWDCHH